MFWLYYIRIIILWTSYSQSFKNHFNWSIKRRAMQNHYLHRSSLFCCVTFLLFNSIVISYQKQSFYLLKALLLRGICIEIRKENLLYWYKYTNLYIKYKIFFSRNKTNFDKAILIMKNSTIYANKSRFIKFFIIINVIPWHKYIWKLILLKKLNTGSSSLFIVIFLYEMPKKHTTYVGTAINA